jgi:hypothetical protein
VGEMRGLVAKPCAALWAASTLPSCAVGAPLHIPTHPWKNTNLQRSTRGIGRGNLRTGHFGGALTLDLESVVLRDAESGLGTGF